MPADRLWSHLVIVKQKPGRLSLHWRQLLLVSAPAGVKSVVQIGAQPGSYNANVTAADGAQRCYTVPSYTSGALHQVVVGLGEEGPLQSANMYFYRCVPCACARSTCLEPPTPLATSCTTSLGITC